MITFQQDGDTFRALENGVVFTTGEEARNYHTGNQTLKLQLSRFQRGNILKRQIPKTILTMEIRQWQQM